MWVEGSRVKVEGVGSDPAEAHHHPRLEVVVRRDLVNGSGFRV